MIVLGINSAYHESAAALLVDGRLREEASLQFGALQGRDHRAKDVGCPLPVIGSRLVQEIETSKPEEVNARLTAYGLVANSAITGVYVI